MPYEKKFEVTQQMLDCLIERAIVAHKSPDSTHAYEKLTEAWNEIEANEINRNLIPSNLSESNLSQWGRNSTKGKRLYWVSEDDLFRLAEGPGRLPYENFVTRLKQQAFRLANS